MTHSFLYGTAVFEGIRAYWNAEQGQLYLLKLREHYERIIDSSKILMMDPGYTVDELMDLTVELLRRNGYKEDAYVRATSTSRREAIGVRLHNVECRSTSCPSRSATTSPPTGASVRHGVLAAHQRPVASRRGPRSWAPT